MLPKKILIISGLSGSGKTTVLRLLEDQGFFAVDNLPIAMLPDLAKMLSGHAQALENGVSVVIDARSAVYGDDVEGVLDGLRAQGISVQLLYLEASEEVLLRRYNFTRRRHPLCFDNTLSAGIALEKEHLLRFRAAADQVIDTSDMSIAELKSRILSILARSATDIQLNVSSFGFKYGIMLDADFVFDVRFLVNPYYVAELKDMSGLDKPVQDYILKDRMAPAFLERTLELFQLMIPVYHLSGKNYLHIAIGCTGGHHRSVFAAEWLGARLADIDGVKCSVRHRDLARG